MSDRLSSVKRKACFSASHTMSARHMSASAKLSCLRRTTMRWVSAMGCKSCGRFSEKDLGLGVPMMRAIDKGLVNSRVGIVLVTPAMLRRLPAEGIADKELSALLRRERLVPVVHGTTYEELEQVSLLLASRAGLSTAEESMAEVATKIAELVAI